MRAICDSGVLVATLTAGWSTSSRAQAPPTPPRRLELTFNNGRVTLIAQGVTVRDIMAEWARQCGCVVQGTDRLTGGAAVPMQFEDQPELAVLESLLRSAGGYLLGPRAPGSRGASIYGSVSVFSVSRGIEAPTYTSSAPIAAPLVMGGTPDDEIPPVTPVANPQTPAQAPARPAAPTPGRPGGPAVPIVPVGSGSTAGSSAGS
ncbi:MAG TPA: hypothetical protein VIX35_06735 [Vicinamibacterales bacterium]